MQAKEALTEADLFIPVLPAEAEPAAQPDQPAQPAPDANQSDQQRVRGKIAEFSRRLQREPNSAKLWMEYIKFQEEAVPIEVGKSNKLSAILVDKKLELFEQALRHLPHDEDLLANYLKEAQAKLSPDELEQKWSEVVYAHPSSAKLWQEYLAYAVSSLARFRVHDVQAKYHQCIQTLDKMREGAAGASASRRAQIEEALLEVVAASCAFLTQAGFQERAVAIFQCLCEVNLSLPGEFRNVVSLQGEPLQFLEAFWESRVGRFGERAAVGFSTWLQHKRAGRPLPVDATSTSYPALPSNPARLEGVTAWQRWLEVEWFREQTHWQSWRPGPGEGDEDLEDVDRLVVFDDVAGHMIRLTSQQRVVELVLMFAEALGAALPPRHSSSHARSLAAAQRMTAAGDMFDSLAACMTALAQSLHRGLEDWERRAPGILPLIANRNGSGLEMVVDEAARPNAARVSGMAVGDLADVWGVLLPGKELRRPGDVEQLDSLLQEAPCGWHPRSWSQADKAAETGRAAMALRVLEQAMALLPQEFALRLAYIDVYQAVDLKAARKATKATLKQAEHRNSLKLYSRFAKLEIAGGNLPDAWKVWVWVKSGRGDLLIAPSPSPPIPPLRSTLQRCSCRCN